MGQIVLTNANNRTALAQHIEIHSHTFNFEQTITLDREEKLQKRLLKEMINKKQDLNTVYYSLICKEKRSKYVIRK